ncbi:hypothetical protein [Hyphobacterium marinum]|uniref:Uncharacterized protein n=1 Tax=Hyphobacterium marinum TaxID=3116574 RepID=A0ABU7LVM9_9PROT|nr:hypothetical protein [Hyphobacterium sp. Y6023]MEE2565612.1 hypothetical protein [Hyphobacterium sp. Y6023]
MGRIFAFLVRLVFTLVLWALAALGAAGLLAAGFVAMVIPYMEPGRNADYSRGWQQLYASFDLDDATSGDCDAIIRDVNIAADANISEAIFVQLVLDAQGRCGDWPEIDPGGLIWYRHDDPQYRRDWDSRFSDAFTRFIREELGLWGDRDYWRRRYNLARRCEVKTGWVNRDLIRYRDAHPNMTAEDSRQFFYTYWFECRRDLVELARYGLASDDIPVRENANGLMNAAARLYDPDALYWDQVEFWQLDPDFFSEFYFGESEEVEPPFPPYCTEDLERRELYRALTGLGHDASTRHWLGQGGPGPDVGLPACQDPVSAYFTQDNVEDITNWRGGYDTPFWYAVHAIRTGDEAATAHLPAIEAEIGAECIAMARIIAGHVASVLPGPPQDIPVARQMIAQSLACQPDDMRDAAAYPDGVYAPVETLLFPSFEPRFVPVRAED